LAKNIYKLNIHYVISGKEGKRKIAPVDYENTGVVHLRMQWSNGLHQFLQLKHGVKLENESLNTTFLSHYIFIRKYISSRENNVYGLTGTLGRDSSQKLLKRLFDVNVIIVPTFRKSNFINLYPKIVKTEENWKKTMLENILNPINNKRVILVICKTIKNVSILADDLKSKNYPEHLIERYERNDSDYRLKDLYGPGSIIFATNLAGRGTDIKLTDEVEKNGGMHVILTFLPENQRIEEQALGRTARSGKNGSGIIIIQNECKILVKNENGREIVINKMFDIISELREKQEKEKLEYIEKKK
jgi:preprotein translocase subunit SecA